MLASANFCTLFCVFSLIAACPSLMKLWENPAEGYCTGTVHFLF